ncbi:MAG: hypothetical protein AAF675_16985, partial [Pseudomonadota bacterium]
ALDAALTWGASAAVTLDGLVTADLDGVAFEPGSAMVAIANRTAHNAQSQTTMLWALAWSADYAVTATKLGTVTDNQPQGAGVRPLAWVPQVVDDALVALNAHLFRFDGVAWVADSSLDPGVPDQGVQPRYAYGPGYALQTMTPVAGMGQITAKAISVAEDGGWNKPGGQTLPPPNSLVPADKAGVASAGGADWAVLGPLVFSRGTSTDWGKIIAATPTADVQADFAGHDGFLSTTIVNQGPRYLAYGLASGSGGRPVQALLLKNGEVKKADHSFDKQSILPGGRGQTASGPSQFATFDATVGSFETTPTLYLNRYAGQDVSGPIRHHTVTAATMTDGFGAVSQTLFRPDTETAACDPTGKVVKFYETTVYPDTEDTKDPRNGWTRTTYVNGLKDVTGADFWNMLDGLKLSTAVYDAQGAEKSSSTTEWRVVDEVGSDPTDPDAAPVTLRGGWVFKVGKTSVTDGVTRQTETGFVSAGCKLAVSGQAITKTVHSWSGAGVAEQFVTTRALAAATSPAIRAIHSLTEPAHTEDSHVSGGTTTLIGATATTYADWATAFDDPVRAPAQAAGYKLREGDAPAFDHAESDAPRKGWVLVGRTTHRTRFGQPSASESALGTPKTMIFDKDDAFSLAEIGNAAPGAAAVSCFEDYEDLSAWTLTGVSFAVGNAYSGTQSALLPGGAGASIAVTVAPGKAQIYVATLRYKTGPSFAHSSKNRLTATPSAGATATHDLPVADDWRYLSLPVTLLHGEDLSLSVSIENGSGSDIWVDQMMVAPLEGSVTARTFAKGPQIVTSATDLGGRSTRTLYNAAFQPTGNVGPMGALREITIHGLSRRGAKGGAFDAAHPNTDVTLRAGQGGTVETFLDGGDWQSRWKPAVGGNWSAEDGRLINKGDGSDSLTWQGVPGEGANALSFRLVPSEGQGVSLRLGGFELDWNGGYSARLDGSALTALLTPPQIARAWLVVFGDGAVLVFVDGQLLFSEKAAVGDGDVVLSLSKGGALIDLAMAAGVELGLTYCDTATKPRQAHALMGDDSVIAGAVFDGLHRRVATTKAIPWSFRASEDTPLLGYSKSFLDVDAFRTAMTGDWKMTGDVADYYTGRENGAVSDDKGYPYVGARYEASPRKRQIEVSRAGVRHAINLTVPAENRATAQIAVGANTGDDVPDLPAGKYPVRTITGPMKSMTRRVNDPCGAKVAGSYHSPDGTRLTGTTGLRRFAEGPTAQLDLKLPKALIDGDESFTRTTVTNALRRTTSLTGPSVGETQFISDDAGNLRFVRPPQAGEPAYYVYYRYDALGRMIEQGIVEEAWDATALQAAANDPDMPKNGSAQITFQYSGDGSDPTLIGMKTESVTQNAAPEGASDDSAMTVTERFAYDGAGHITGVSQAIDGGAPVTIGYAYDALSRLSQITPPSGAPVKAITYSRDGLGRVTAVGKTAGGSEFGRYVYTANGDLQTETLGGAWTRSFAYQPDGALASVSTKGQGKDGLDMTFGYDADGMMTARDMVFAGGLGERFTDTVAYDAQRRIKSASGSSDAHYGAYDANGNILKATEGGKTSTFTLKEGSDRLSSAAIDGGEAAPITWTPQGCMAEGLGRTFAYDRATGATTMVTTKAGQTRFAYGGLRQRVVKHGPEGKTVYLHGTGRTPVARSTPRGMEVEVLGPTGLIAVVSDRARFPITDTQGSVWAVADEKGIVATYAYSPFGRLLNSAGPEAERFAYRWQGR